MRALPNEIRKLQIELLTAIWGDATFDFQKWKWNTNSPPQNLITKLLPYLTGDVATKEQQDELQSLISEFVLPLPPEPWALPPQLDYTPSQLSVLRRHYKITHTSRRPTRLFNTLKKQESILTLDNRYVLARAKWLTCKRRDRLMSSLDWYPGGGYQQQCYEPTNQTFPNEYGKWQQPDGSWVARTIV